MSLILSRVERARIALSRGLGTQSTTHRRVPREVVRFVVVVVLVATIIGLGVFVVLSQEASAEAQRGAEEIARVQGLGIVQPALTDRLVQGDPDSLADLDRVVRDRVLDARTVRVKIWTSTGQIIYSDESRLIGQTFSLGSNDLAILGSNLVDSDISDLSRPENQFERSFGQLLEVYLPLQTPSGTKVLFETYQKFTSVQDQQRRMLLDFGPVLIGGLLLLLVLEIPLAWSMARRLEVAGVEREALLTRAVHASETERRKIASDLHDGVVQRLVGTSMSLGAASKKVDQSRDGETDPQMVKALQQGAGELREAVRELRTLIVKIAPTGLTGDTLADALNDLVEPMRARGIEAEVRLDGSRLDPAEAKLIFRVAQEALRNVALHSGAKHVTVEVAASTTGRTLTVSDDGRGFDPGAIGDRRLAGHVGLTLLKSLAEDGGAEMRVVSSPGQGSRLEMRLR